MSTLSLNNISLSDIVGRLFKGMRNRAGMIVKSNKDFI